MYVNLSQIDFAESCKWTIGFGVPVAFPNEKYHVSWISLKTPLQRNVSISFQGQFIRVLTICQNKPVGTTVNNGKSFSKTKQTNRTR